jgi:hypothetical protein
MSKNTYVQYLFLVPAAKQTQEKGKYKTAGVLNKV